MWWTRSEPVARLAGLIALPLLFIAGACQAPRAPLDFEGMDVRAAYVEILGPG